MSKYKLKKRTTKKLYYMRYELYKSYWRHKIDLRKMSSIIEAAVLSQIPNAVVTVTKRDYSFWTDTKPTRGNVSMIGQYISYNSPLNQIVVEYPSTANKHKPTRHLFQCVEKNFKF